MDELTQLAIKYGTDKWGKHHYTPVYYELFKDRRDDIRKVVEIGPAEGAGLFMFEEFFTSAMIYGAEIDSDRVAKLQGNERINVFICDQSKISDLQNLIKRVGTDVDLFIDDGSHKPSDQVLSCVFITAHMKKGGIYIIEDVADTQICIDLIDNGLKPELIRVGTRYDDQLVIIKT